MKLCNYNQEDLTSSVLGELPGARAEEVARHVASCPSCREEAEAVRLMTREIESLPVADPGELFFHRQLRQIEAQVQAREERTKSFFGAWYPAMAAAAVFLLLIGYSTWNRHSKSSWTNDWGTALSFLAEEAEPVFDWPEIEDLDDKELDLVAQDIEGEILKDEADTWFDEPGDFQELNEKEIDQLLDRLAAEGLRRHT